MSQAITPSQIAKLEKLEAVIRRGLQTFVEVGDSLRVIRDEKLYSRDYDSFEAYCETVWGWSRRRGNQLIQSAELVNALPPTLAAAVTTEHDARELLALPSADQKAAIREAKKEGITVAESAKSFQEKPAAIDQKPGKIFPQPKSKPNEKLDATGRVIPPEILEDWDRAAQVAARLRSCASEIKLTVERGLADKDIIFGELTNPTVSEAASLFHTLSHIVPHAVCPECQGKTRKNCQLCKRRGWISKFLYQSPAVSAATKAMIERARP